MFWRHRRVASQVVLVHLIAVYYEIWQETYSHLFVCVLVLFCSPYFYLPSSTFPCHALKCKVGTWVKTLLLKHPLHVLSHLHNCCWDLWTLSLNQECPYSSARPTKTPETKAKDKSSIFSLTWDTNSCLLLYVQEKRILQTLLKVSPRYLAAIKHPSSKHKFMLFTYMFWKGKITLLGKV